MSANELVSGAAGEGLDLLPNNATPFERVHSRVSARLFDLNVGIIEQSRDPAHCDAAFVPFLAWERSVHFWSATDEAGNRARIESSFNDHLNYGSPQALEAEIALDTGQNIRVVEYFEDPSLVWPEFAVASVIDPGDPLPDIDALMASALTRKNVRDMPGARVLARQPAGACFVGGGTGVTVTAKILSAVPPQPSAFIGAGTGVTVTAKILPLGARS
jgi:phage tail P2-like protein